MIDRYSALGFRLLALAKGVIRDGSQQALSMMTQEQLERQVDSFQLIGLLVLSNHLRSDSKDTISELHQ